MISFTKEATLQIKKMMEDEPEGIYLRFGVYGGGCSGLNYQIGFSEEKEADESIHTINEIPVLLKESDERIIAGTVIDYKENLAGGGFSIHNPNAIFTCGCGSSFRTKEVVGEKGDC